MSNAVDSLNSSARTPLGESAPQPAAPGPASERKRFFGGRIGKPKTVLVDGVHEVGVPHRFIAVSRAHLMARLTAPEYWEGHDRAAVVDALHCLGRIRQQDSCVKLDQLMDAYQPFNPDDTTEFRQPLTWEQKSELRETFLAGMEQLVFRANFAPITREELDKILSQTSPYGVEVDVDLDEFEPLLPFYRGLSHEDRARRDWRWAYLLKRTYTLPSYERLFIALTLKPAEKRIAEIEAKFQLPRAKAIKKFRKMRRALPDWVSSDHIYLKMFKDIPQLDIDMLLPNGGVRFNPFDRIMLWVSGGGSALYALVVAILKIVAVAISPVLLVMTLFGFGGALWRQVASVLNTRNRYMMELSQKLYFHAMSNNQGVLTLLVDESEEEDIKEEALLYAFLLNAAIPRPNFDGLKTSIESFIKREFNLDIDFDHEETLARLKTRGVVEETDGEIRAMPAVEASAYLRKLWAAAIDINPGDATSLDGALTPPRTFRPAATQPVSGRGANGVGDSGGGAMNNEDAMKAKGEGVPDREAI